MKQLWPAVFKSGGPLADLNRFSFTDWSRIKAFKSETTKLNYSVAPCLDSKTMGNNWKLNQWVANACRCVFLEIIVFLITSFCSTLKETFSKLIPLTTWDNDSSNPTSTAAIDNPMQVIKTLRLHTWRPEVLESRTGKSSVSRTPWHERRRALGT